MEAVDERHEVFDAVCQAGSGAEAQHFARVGIDVDGAPFGILHPLPVGGAVAGVVVQHQGVHADSGDLLKHALPQGERLQWLCVRGGWFDA